MLEKLEISNYKYFEASNKRIQEPMKRRKGSENWDRWDFLFKKIPQVTVTGLNCIGARVERETIYEVVAWVQATRDGKLNIKNMATPTFTIIISTSYFYSIEKNYLILIKYLKCLWHIVIQSINYYHYCYFC